MLNLPAVFDLLEPERSARLREARKAALLLLGGGHPLKAQRLIEEWLAQQ